MRASAGCPTPRHPIVLTAVAALAAVSGSATPDITRSPSLPTVALVCHRSSDLDTIPIARLPPAVQFNPASMRSRPAVTQPSGCATSQKPPDSQGIGNLIQDADWARRPAWMGKPYSIDLRERVGAEIASGQSRRAAARRYDVSASFAVKLADRISQTGSAEPARQGRPPGGGKLAPYLAALLEWVEADPDITMPELAAKLEAEKAVTAHPASLSRVLLKAGLSFKKNTAGHGGRARGRAPGA